MENKSGASCLVKGLIILAVSILSVILVGIGTGYYVLYHSAIPARGIASLINQSPDIQIEGITGSLSSGLAVETIRVKDENGNTNELDDVRFFYEKDGETFVINELHVGRAHFYYDRSSGELTADDPDSESSRPSSVEDDPNKESMDLDILVRKASFNNIIVEDIASGEQFVLEKGELTDLKLGKKVSLGSLIVKSTTCSVAMNPVEGSDKDYTLDVLLKPGLHKNIISPIDIGGTVTLLDGGKSDFKGTAFNGKVNITAGQDKTDLTVKDLTLADYLKGAPPVENITLTLKGDDKQALLKGSFLVADKTFAIDQKLQGDKKDEVPIIATHTSGGITYTLEIQPKSDSESLYPPMKLTTSPKTAYNDAISMLITGKKGGSLSADEKDSVNQAKTFFLEVLKAKMPAKK